MYTAFCPVCHAQVAPPIPCRGYRAPDRGIQSFLCKCACQRASPTGQARNATNLGRGALSSRCRDRCSPAGRGCSRRSTGGTRSGYCSPYLTNSGRNSAHRSRTDRYGSPQQGEILHLPSPSLSNALHHTHSSSTHLLQVSTLQMPALQNHLLKVSYHTLRSPYHETTNTLHSYGY